MLARECERSPSAGATASSGDPPPPRGPPACDSCGWEVPLRGNICEVCVALCLLRNLVEDVRLTAIEREALAAQILALVRLLGALVDRTPEDADADL